MTGYLSLANSLVWFECIGCSPVLSVLAEWHVTRAVIERTGFVSLLDDSLPHPAASQLVLSTDCCTSIILHSSIQCIILPSSIQFLPLFPSVNEAVFLVCEMRPNSGSQSSFFQPKSDVISYAGHRFRRHRLGPWLGVSRHLSLSVIEPNTVISINTRRYESLCSD